MAGEKHVTEVTEPQQPSAPVNEHVARLLAQITADVDNLSGLVVGFVRKDGNAAVRYTPMATAMLAHLSRIFDLKIDREYQTSMFPAATQGVRPPAANPVIANAMRKIVKDHIPSPAGKIAERERERNKAKAAKKNGKGSAQA